MPEPPIDDAFARGIAAHRAGDLKTAAALYRRAADARPDDPQVWHHLGVAAEDLGQHATAIACAQRALALSPGLVPALINLGRACVSSGDPLSAVHAYRRALAIAPGTAGILASLASAALRLGRYDMAQLHYRRALLLQPAAGEWWAALGGLHCHRRRLAAAEPCLRRAHVLRGGHMPTALALASVLLARGSAAEALDLFTAVAQRPQAPADAVAGMAACQAALGRMDAAAQSFARAVAQHPDRADFRIGLADALRGARRLEPAIAEARRALALAPDNARAMATLAAALHAAGRRAEAVDAYGRALAADPGLAEARANLGAALISEGRLGEAERQLRWSLRLNPRSPQAWNNLGNALAAAGDGRAAEDAYRRALDLRPDDAEAHSNLLLTLHYREDLSPGDLADAHRAWAGRHAPATPPRPALPDAGDRPLRVGYLSADFRTHSVSYFFEPLLAAHDPRHVEATCYSDVASPDETTARLQAKAARWRPIAGLSNADVAEQVRRDGIDILVDLGGHTAGSRLLVFARRPAPVQVTWLGYPDTTGLDAIDARLTDGIADPPGEADILASERLVRLETGFLCYQPPPSPAVGPLPAITQGGVTFGSFNNLAKLTPGVTRLWAQLVAAIPGARLLLKARALADPEVRRRLGEAFARHGLAPDRLLLMGPVPGRDGHLATYAQVDIGLDPFPYGGTTTTCEALWMGVPVVTLAGDRHAARVGASLLTRLDLARLVATTPDRYVRLATDLARDLPRLQAMREGLRTRMAASPLMDAPGFARGMEAAYRRLWQDVAGHPTPR